mgnify:CR=1 FL=1
MMTDPYRVLEISPDASDEEVKASYRRLSEKYDAENYSGNPLADLAAKKQKDINDAYDRIMAERSIQARQNPRAAQNTYNDRSQVFSNYDSVAIRNMINSGRTGEAEETLKAIKPSFRDAEWNFLMGSVAHAKGWLDEAERYFSIATSMQPSNKEYSAAYNRMKGYRQGNAPGNPYGGYDTQRRSGGGCSGCDICTGLLCADCCCECMGGDLIRCC